jgi:hypothetical protein
VRVTGVLALVAVLGAPPTVARAAPDAPLAPVDADTAALTRRAAARLVDAARAAHARRDPDAVEQRLRAWASLGTRDGALPEGLTSEADAAQAWARERGGFALFASTLTDRVSVGVRDPAGVLTRVDAWVEEGGALKRILRAEAERVDRREYRFGEAQLASATIVLDAIGTIDGDDVILARLVLRPSAALSPPLPPDATKLAERRRPARDVTPEAEGALVPWWWIVAGAAASALVGAAIWQESRF